MRRFLVLVACCIATRIAAQVPVPVAATSQADSVASFERPNGALMRLGSLTYALSLVRTTGQTVSLGTRSVAVSESPLGGSPVWLIAESRRGTAVETSDSVWLAHADLAPIRWTSLMGRSTLAASFTRDSVYGGVESYQGRASFIAAVPANALLSAGMVERLLEMLPLRAGYRASASLLLVEGAAARMVPAQLSLDREVRISFGGRDVDCWLVALRTGAMEERFWITKDGARVIRTEQAVAEGLLVSQLQP